MPKDIERPVSADGRRRSHVSTACETCRTRKTKCDGVQPECGTCRAQGHECTWSTRADRRREVTNRQQEIQKELKELKDELADVKSKLEAHVNSRHPTPEPADGGVRRGEAMKYRAASPSAEDGLLHVPGGVVSDDAAMRNSESNP